MFQEWIALRTAQDKAAVGRELRDNLRYGRTFGVSSIESAQREVVRAYLDQYNVPYAFFSGDGVFSGEGDKDSEDRDKSHRWKCLVGFAPGGMTYIEGGPLLNEVNTDEAELQRIREQTGLNITVAKEERLGDGPPQVVRRY
jgi:hypothetical protein